MWSLCRLPPHDSLVKTRFTPSQLSQNKVPGYLSSASLALAPQTLPYPRPTLSLPPSPSCLVPLSSLHVPLFSLLTHFPSFLWTLVAFTLFLLFSSLLLLLLSTFPSSSLSPFSLFLPTFILFFVLPLLLLRSCSPLFLLFPLNPLFPILVLSSLRPLVQAKFPRLNDLASSSSAPPSLSRGGDQLSLALAVVFSIFFPLAVSRENTK